MFSPIPYFKCGALLDVCRCVRLASGGYGYKADSVFLALKAATKAHWAGGPLDRPNNRSKYDTEKFENLADLLGFLDFVGDWR